MKSLFILLASLSTAACVETTPQWDRQFGNSVHAAVASQRFNPGEAVNRNPVTGIDSAAALGAQKRYERSFAQPESQANSSLINAVGK